MTVFECPLGSVILRPYRNNSNIMDDFWITCHVPPPKSPGSSFTASLRLRPLMPRTWNNQRRRGTVLLLFLVPELLRPMCPLSNSVAIMAKISCPWKKKKIARYGQGDVLEPLVSNWLVWRRTFYFQSTMCNNVYIQFNMKWSPRCISVHLHYSSINTSKQTTSTR